MGFAKPTIMSEVYLPIDKGLVHLGGHLPAGEGQVLSLWGHVLPYSSHFSSKNDEITRIFWKSGKGLTVI